MQTQGRLSGKSSGQTGLQEEESRQITSTIDFSTLVTAEKKLLGNLGFLDQSFGVGIGFANFPFARFHFGFFQLC